MSEADETTPATAVPQHTPEVTAWLLATFADLYRQEVGAEEDVHRTLPFFGTALGIIIASLAYAAGRLPKWPDLTPGWGQDAFCAAALLLALAVFEAGCVLVWISLAIARRNYERIGPEAALREEWLNCKPIMIHKTSPARPEIRSFLRMSGKCSLILMPRQLRPTATETSNATNTVHGPRCIL